MPITVIAVCAPTAPTVKDEFQKNLQNVIDSIPNSHSILLTARKVSVFGVFLVHISPHSDQKNSEYRHFLRSEWQLILIQEVGLTLKVLANFSIGNVSDYSACMLSFANKLILSDSCLEKPRLHYTF